MVEKQHKPRIAWGITGAGHFLEESVELLIDLDNVDVFISLAAKEVLQYYDLWNRIENAHKKIIVDNSSSAMSVTKLYTGGYNCVVIAPMTGNTMAKVVNGIADNLVTNLFAHSGKCNIKTLVLPCDVEEKTESLTHKNEKVIINLRDVEKKNLSELKRFKNVTLAQNSKELAEYLKII